LFSIVELNCWFIDIHPYFCSILNALRIQCIDRIFTCYYNSDKYQKKYSTSFGQREVILSPLIAYMFVIRTDVFVFSYLALANMFWRRLLLMLHGDMCSHSISYSSFVLFYINVHPFSELCPFVYTKIKYLIGGIIKLVFTLAWRFQNENITINNPICQLFFFYNLIANKCHLLMS